MLPGVVKEVESLGNFRQLFMARASPKARATPKITAVKIPGFAALVSHAKSFASVAAPMADLA